MFLVVKLICTSGPPRQRVKFDTANRCLKDIFQEYGGELSQLAMKELLHDRGVKVSSGTICQIMNSEHWIAKKLTVLPINTDKHRAARLSFATQNIDNSFGGDGDPVLWIDIDEKNFYSFTQRIVYCPKEYEAMFQYVHEVSKQKPESVMFFAAVSKPRLSVGFDGRILLLPVCKKKVQQKKSKYGAKGSIIYEKITMNAELFQSYIKVNVIFLKCILQQRLMFNLGASFTSNSKDSRRAP